MRPGFERALRDYGELAKDELEQERAPDISEGEANATAPVSAEVVASALEYRIKKSAESMGTTEEKQRRIYVFQKEKQEIMRALKEQLRCIDGAECNPEIPDGAHRVQRTGDSYHCAFTMPDGSVRDVDLTLGDILTDGEWGVRYALDSETVPRDVRKKYSIESAKRDLRYLANLQIVTGEGASTGAHAHEEQIRRGASLDAGFVAEKLMLTFLQKLAYDHGVRIVAEPADEYEDSVRKIDFLIKRLTHRRGARVEEDPHLASVGVQFTIGGGGGKKRRQIDKEKERTEQDPTRGVRIDDLVLVKVNAPDLARAYAQWISSGRPPGGPAREWVRAYRADLLSGLLQQMYSEEEIRKITERVDATQPLANLDQLLAQSRKWARGASESRGRDLLNACGKLVRHCWQRISGSFGVPQGEVEAWAHGASAPPPNLQAGVVHAVERFAESEMHQKKVERRKRHRAERTAHAADAASPKSPPSSPKDAAA